MTQRAPRIGEGIILPPPTTQYDADNERQARRIIGDALNRRASSDVLATLTPYAETILAAASAADARTLLGLGSVALLNTNGDATKFLDGTGAWTSPSGGSGGSSFIGEYDQTLTTYTTGDMVRYRRDLYYAKVASIAAGSTVDTTHALYTNLVGLYPLYEGTGGPANLIDAAAGTLSGGRLPAWKWHTLHFKGGASLNSYVQLYAASAGAALAGLQAGNMTIWLRVIWDGAAAGGFAERNDNNTVNSGWVFGVAADGSIGFLVERTTGNLSRTSQTGALAAGLVQDVAVTYTGSGVATDVHIYVDGVEVASYAAAGNGAGTVGTGDSGFPLRLGNAAFNAPVGSSFAGAFSGRILAAAFWKGTALTSAQLASLASSPLMPELPSNPAKWGAMTGLQTP